MALAAPVDWKVKSPAEDDSSEIWNVSSLENEKMVPGREKLAIAATTNMITTKKSRTETKPKAKEHQAPAAVWHLNEPVPQFLSV